MNFKIGDKAKNKRTGKTGNVILVQDDLVRIELDNGVHQGGPPSIFEKIDN